MSIKKIKVITDDGPVEVGSGMALDASDGMSLAYAAGTVTMSATPVEDLMSAALEKLLGPSRYVSKINGSPAGADGMFAVLGDGCLSWTTALDASDSVSDPHITLYDLCPACESCDVHARLLRRLEQCKVAINALKDVNLYTNAAASARREWLIGRMAELPEACDVGDGEPYEIFSSRLMRQYMAMVHMWNYVVSTRNNANEIEVSPETPCGMAVRTRHALPDCDSSATMQVTISVSPNSLADDQSDNLSMYIPDVVCEYLPFPGTASTVSSHSTSGLNGTVTATFSGVTGGGTAVVLAKFIPFVSLELRDTSGALVSDVRTVIGDVAGVRDDSDSISIPDESDTPIVISADILRTGITASVVRRDNATKVQYDASAGYPSVSVAGSNVWQVTIAWQVTGPNAVSHSDTYLFSAAPARVPVLGIMQDDVRLARV